MVGTERAPQMSLIKRNRTVRSPKRFYPRVELINYEYIGLVSLLTGIQQEVRRLQSCYWTSNDEKVNVRYGSLLPSALNCLLKHTKEMFDEM